MTETDLAREIVAAEDALRSPEMETARARLREIDSERIHITETLDAAEMRVADAKERLRAFFLGISATDEDIHAAVAAIADAPPETVDRSNEPEEGESQPLGYVLADGARFETHMRATGDATQTQEIHSLNSDPVGDDLPALEDLSEDDQDAVMAVLDDATPFAGIGGTTGLVIGRPGEVSDAAVADAQSLDRREAEHANGGARFNPWA